ncbi:MAG: alkaline phosphatase family protein [Acidobacteria bacterium]|nr:alkaline phosphatase family protein [Acidobacteriota bacterium]
MRRRLLRTAILAALLACGGLEAQAYVGPGAGFAFLSSFLVLIVVFVAAVLSLLAWPFRFAIRLLRGRKAYGKTPIKKVVVLGLDGMDPNLAERFMEEGKLPHLASLRAKGGYARLGTTTPSISPVAWSSFMTGVNPAKHNIFDFLGRDPRNYLPNLSSAYIGKPKRVLSLGKYNIPLSKPEIRGMRKSVPFWKILGDQGILCTVLRVPITFPPEKFKGHLLSGMCAPDLKGSQGTFSFYTSDPAKAKQVEGGVFIPVTVQDGKVTTYVSGPENTMLKDAPEMRLPLAVTLRPATDEAEIALDGQKLVLKKGQMSPWVRLTFRPGMGIKVRAICRLIVSQVSPHFELYMSPLNIDPDRPALPISHPFYYAIYLSKMFGPYVTLGLANDTWALNEGALDEQGFLDLAYAHHAEWEKMFFNALDKTRRGVVACVFETTDSLQHMFFRYLDPKHPALRNGQARMSAAVVEDLYQRMDATVGRTLEKLGPDSVLIVMSDHGFKQFKRGINLNTWLLQHGYLVLKDGADGKAEWLRDVDWSKTRAYALGLAGIFINQKGREAHGIVSKSEAEALKTEMAVQLSGMKDPADGEVAINEAFDREKIKGYSGPYKENCPDLVIGYNEGYRASWDSVKGVITSEVFEDNTKCWSGDHCIDPRTVPGVVFCNHSLAGTEPKIWDIAPSTLHLFGVAVPPHMDGKPLLDPAVVGATAGAGKSEAPRRAARARHATD